MEAKWLGSEHWVLNEAADNSRTIFKKNKYKSSLVYVLASQQAKVL